MIFNGEQIENMDNYTIVQYFIAQVIGNIYPEIQIEQITIKSILRQLSFLNNCRIV